MTYLAAQKPRIVIGIPRWGRSGCNSLKLWASKGYLSQGEVEYWIATLKSDRERIENESHEIVYGERPQFSPVWKVANILNRDRFGIDEGGTEAGEPIEAAKYLTTHQNTSRRGTPTRIEFHEYETETEYCTIVFRGIGHEEAPVLLQKGDIHASTSGYDEYEALALGYAGNGNNPYRRWESIELGHEPGPMGIVAIGAAGLEDPTVHALICPWSKDYRSEGGVPDLSGENVIIVDPFYRPIYGRELRIPRDRADTMRDYRTEDPDLTKKLEDMCIDRQVPGVAIINEGTTLAEINRGRPKLRVIGEDLAFSETLFLTTEDNLRNKQLMRILESVDPVRYRDARRLAYLERWHQGVRRKIGDYWDSMPPLDKLVA